MIVTFCGHSKYFISEEDKLEILDILEKEGAEEITFYLGGYGAFDSAAFDCAKRYQKSHPKSQLVFITPYPHYGKTEGASDIYDEIIYPEIENVPPKFAIVKRNEWMMKNADLVIAYILHDWGGAYKAFQVAKREKKRIINIAKERRSL